MLSSGRPRRPELSMCQILPCVPRTVDRRLRLIRSTWEKEAADE
jgi:hypothetical protein